MKNEFFVKRGVACWEVHRRTPGTGQSFVMITYPSGTIGHQLAYALMGVLTSLENVAQMDEELHKITNLRGN
jgi:hypothetical protein